MSSVGAQETVHVPHAPATLGRANERVRRFRAHEQFGGEGLSTTLTEPHQNIDPKRQELNHVPFPRVVSRIYAGE